MKRITKFLLAALIVLALTLGASAADVSAPPSAKIGAQKKVGFAAGQLLFSFAPIGGQGTTVIIDVATKEEAAQRIVDAMQGKLFTPVALWGNPDPRLWVGRPIYVGLSLPPEWIPWIKEKFATVEAHF